MRLARLIVSLFAPLLALALLAPQAAEAQIAFRSAASASARPATFRAASSMTLGISFVAASAATTTTATLTIARPGATQLDDMLIASIAVRPTTAAITPPAGWVLVGLRLDNAAVTANSLAVFRKAVAAGEPASYAFTVTGSTDSVGGIQGFRNVDLATPIDVQAGVNTPSGLGHTAPSITTTVANAMLVTSHAYSSAQSFSTPAGMAQPFDVRSLATAGAGGETISGNFELRAAAGATGTRTATAPLDADTGNAHSLALTPAAATALRINLPAGTAANDVLIASIGVQPSTTAITPPSAFWTLVRRIDNGASNSLAVYRLVAGAAEPAFYDWSLTGVSFAVGGIQSFFDMDTASPIDVENGQTTASALTHATPSVVTTVPNAMVVTSHTYASSRFWAPPAGMTESFDRPSGVLAAAGQSIEGNRALQAAAGATGARTATAGADADVGNAHIFALRPATPSLTIAKPAGTVANDVMVAAVGIRPSTATITTPAGWTLVRRIDNATGTTNSLAVYTRVAGAAEPASYTWGIGGGFTGAVGGIQSFSGVDTTTQIDVENGQATPSALTHATPSVVTTVSDVMLVTHHSYSSSRNWSPPAGMTESFDQVSTVLGAVGQSIEGNRVLLVVPGATGVKTATAAADADTGNAHILVLRPAQIIGEFNAYESSTPPAAILGVIKTRIAGAPASLDIIAINAAKTAILPTFTGTVRVEVLDASDNTGAMDAFACRPTWTVVQTLAPDPIFGAADNGRKTISFTQPNSYPNARLRISFPVVGPTVFGCSKDNFAIRPNAFANFSVTDADWQTPGIVRALNEVTFGAVTHKAGRAFTVRADAMNAAGVPAITTNYTGTPAPTLSACVGAACTAGFGTFTLGASFALGQLNSSAATYGEVGSFALQLLDSTFASVDAADGSTPAERNIVSSTINVGRFVPDHFAVALNAPAFGTACGAFTYVGQAFNYTTQPVITVTAQGFANNTTTLYAGAWSRITNSTVTPATQAARYSRFDALGGGTTPGLDTSGLPLPAGDPAIGVFTNGVGALTFSSGTGLGFVRSTTTPNAPFNADIALALNVIDTDSVAYASNPAAFGTATAGNGIAFSSGKPMRFGRLRLDNAVGSGNLDLPIPIQTQYWSGTAFQTNTADNCTSISAANIGFSSYSGGISAANMNSANISGLGGPFASGVGSLTLTKPLPAPGSPGAVTLTVNLTAEAKPYLKGNWGVPTFTADPTSRAAFGLYGSQPKNFIFFRENY